MEYKHIIFILSLIILPLVGVSQSEIYINEFGRENSTCEISDTFIYRDSEKYFFDIFNRNIDRVIVVYSCCLNEDCSSFLFDLSKKSFLDKQTTIELIHLNYIRSKILSGNISSIRFNLEGLSVCDLSDLNKLNQGSVNLVVDVANKASLYVASAKIAKNIKVATNLAKGAGLISKVNYFSLAGSVVCSYGDKQVSDSLETILSCNIYIENLEKGYSSRGYFPKLYYCLEEGKEDLSVYLSKYLTNLKHLLDKTVNTVVGTGKFLWNLGDSLSNNEKVSSLEIKKTDKEIIEEIYSMITSKEFEITNPYSKQIYNKQELELSSKIEKITTNYNSQKSQFNNLKKKVPSKFWTWIKNIFISPNKDYSNIWEIEKEIKGFFKDVEGYYANSRYNSAIKSQLKIEIKLLDLERPVTQK